MHGSEGNVVRQVPTILNGSTDRSDYTCLLGLLSGNVSEYRPILNLNDVNGPTCISIRQYNERPLLHAISL